MKQYDIDAILQANLYRMIVKNYSKRTIYNYNGHVKKFLEDFKGNYQRATVDDLCKALRRKILYTCLDLLL